MSEKFETISAAKANHLLWLGRYAQRVYLTLHFMRRICDALIDDQNPDIHGYYARLGATPRSGDDAKSFFLSQIYDKENSGSLLRQVMAAHDNAIVLREEIKSESLAYIQLSLSLIERCAARGELNITELQPVTDYMLAFFGCVYERVNRLAIRDLINIGRHLESMDMHLRFDYDVERIVEIYERLKECQARQLELFDRECSLHLDEELLVAAACNLELKEHKNQLLQLICNLVTI